MILKPHASELELFLRWFVKNYNIPCVQASALVSMLDDCGEIDTTTLLPVVAVCGIADPLSFTNTLQEAKMFLGELENNVDSNNFVYN